MLTPSTSPYRSPRRQIPPSFSLPLLTPGLETPSLPTPVITTSTLRTHSLYIRDVLQPSLSPSIPHLPPTELYTLTIILAQLSTLQPPALTLDMLRGSRIVKALNVIVAPEEKGRSWETGESTRGRWPTDSFIQAKKILRKWEREFGGAEVLRSLRVDLFGKGERLWGIVAAKAEKTTHRSVIVPDEVLGTIWSLIHPQQRNPHLALNPGHVALAPGTWHLNLTSLLNANLISHPRLSAVSFDSERAYSVTLLAYPSGPPTSSPPKHSPAQLRNMAAWDTGDEVKFTIVQAGKLDLGAARLMKTMRENDEKRRMNVRVWRHFSWGGDWAPRAGVRYDGLYTIQSYSVKVSPLPESMWTVSFILKRESNQFALSTVRHIPTTDQYDDWEDFLALAESDGGVSREEADTKSTQELPLVKGQSLAGLEKSVWKKALARADTAAVVEESLLEAVRMKEDESVESEGKTDEKRRDSGYFSLVTSRGS